MKRVGLVAIGVASLFLAGEVAHAQLRAMTPQTPTVVTGGDFGFRIEGVKGDTPVGTFVVRGNGGWIPVEISGAGVKQITLR